MEKTGNIPGVYNYCDRWCERCPFTSRCASYEHSSVFEAKTAGMGMDAPEFWEALHQNLSETVTMVKNMMREQGLDPDKMILEDDEAYEEQRKKTKALMKQHPLHQLSNRYSKEALKVIETAPQLDEKGDERLTGTGPAGNTNTPALLRVSDCMEVVRWYLFFIGSKVARALNGKLEDDGWELENGFQRDFDGSAKIAMIAMERSIAAWARLLRHFTELEDDILPLLVTLQKMYSLTEQEFPEAKNFIRPGFDNPNVTE